MTITHDTHHRRTLGSLLLRVLVPRVVVFGVTASILGLVRRLSLERSPQESAEQLPAWTVADQHAHPRCVPFASWPEGRPAEFIVACTFRNHVRRKVSFAEAWQRNHDRTEVDDVWVLGVCRVGGRHRNPGRLGADAARKAGGRCRS